MTPAPQGWRGLAGVRGSEIAVGADRALSVRAPGGGRRVAAPGEVTRVALVDDPRSVGVRPSRHDVAEMPVDAYGLLVFLAGRRPVLALRLGEWLPGAHRYLDGPAARHASGAEEVARALRVPLEGDDGSGIDHEGGGVRRVLVRGLADLPGWYRGLVAAVAIALPVVLVLALLGGESSRAEIVGLSSPEDAVLPTWAAVALAGLAASQVLGGFTLHAQARRLHDRAPGAGVRVVRPRPGDPVDRGFRDHARLELSRETVVLTDGAGREAWLTGPDRGGVSTLSVAGDALVLRDAGDRILAVLDSRAWVGATDAGDQLTEACGAVGIQVQREPAALPPDSFAGPHVLLPLVAPFLRRVEARGLPSNILLLPALLGVDVMVASQGSGLAALVFGVVLLAGSGRVLVTAVHAYRVNVTVPPLDAGARRE